MATSSTCTRCSLATDCSGLHPFVSSRPAGELERVDLGEGRLIAALRDTRDQDELVEEISDLRRGLVDHLDVTRRRICELDPGERPCEAVHRGQGRADVVARDRDQARKAFVGQGAATLAA